MIATDFELVFAAERLAAQHRDRYAIFDDDPPSAVRILLRLPAAHRFPDVQLDAAIFASPSNAVGSAEVALFSIPASQAASFHSFDHNFCVSEAEKGHIRIDFLVREDGGGREKIAQAVVPFAQLVHSVDERLEVQVVPVEGAVEGGYGFISTKAELGLEWMNSAGVQIWLEVRIRVNKHGGWPFSTARPFFMVYKWEPRLQIWMALYRSEVLCKASDREDADGAMIFEIAPIMLGTRSSEEDERPLRIEFFHYKTVEQPPLVASMSTNLRSLRQTQAGERMKLNLNTFIKGELTGELTMHNSRVTLKRHFVSLKADFGDRVEAEQVVLDLKIDKRELPAWKSWRLRPYFMISRYGDSGKWDNVYRSEAPMRSWGYRVYRYKLAKFTEWKLNEGSIHRKWSIMFYYESDHAEPVEIGHIETTVSTLLDADVGSIFPLETPTGKPEGYIRLELAEAGENGFAFAATCVLGKTSPKSCS